VAGGGAHNRGRDGDEAELEGWDSASEASGGLESDKDSCLDEELDDDDDPLDRAASDYNAWRKKLAFEVTILSPLSRCDV
jgi:hypothetical protein